jgi:hypothetical protein
MLRTLIVRLLCRAHRLPTGRNDDENDPLRVFDFLGGWQGSLRGQVRRIKVK